MPDRSRRSISPLRLAGFTLIELLVVIAIIGMLVVLLIPAIQAARSSSRRTQCTNNLRQLGIALSNYESTRRRFPNGAISRAFPQQPTTPHNFYRWSTLAQLTPYLEQTAAYNALDMSVPLYGKNFQVLPVNQEGVARVVPEFLCPSDRGRRISPAFGPTNYAACTGTGSQGGSPFEADGTFYINSQIPVQRIKDGLSHTVALAESVLGREIPRLTPRQEADPGLSTCLPRALHSPRNPAVVRRFGTTASPAGSPGSTVSSAVLCTTIIWRRTRPNSTAFRQESPGRLRSFTPLTAGALLAVFTRAVSMS